MAVCHDTYPIDRIDGQYGDTGTPVPVFYDFDHISSSYQDKAQRRYRREYDHLTDNFADSGSDLCNGTGGSNMVLRYIGSDDSGDNVRTPIAPYYT